MIRCDTGTCCLEKLRNLRPWRYSELDWIQTWATWFSWPYFAQGFDQMIPRSPLQFRLLSESMKYRQLHAAFLYAPKRTQSPCHSCVNELKWHLDWSWNTSHQLGRESQMPRKWAKLAGSCLHLPAETWSAENKVSVMFLIKRYNSSLLLSNIICDEKDIILLPVNWFIPLWNVTILPHATWYSRLLVPISALHMISAQVSLSHYPVFEYQLDLSFRRGCFFLGSDECYPSLQPPDTKLKFLYSQRRKRRLWRVIHPHFSWKQAW